MSGRGGTPDETGPEQGLDEGVVVSADVGSVAGLGPQEALDELEEDAEHGSGDATG